MSSELHATRGGRERESPKAVETDYQPSSSCRKLEADVAAAKRRQKAVDELQAELENID